MPGAQRQGELRRELGDAAFDGAYGEGAELGLEEAAALALGVEHPDLAAGSARFGAGQARVAPRQPVTPDRRRHHTGHA